MPPSFAVQPVQSHQEPAPPVLEPWDPTTSVVPWSAEIRFDNCEVVFTGPGVGVFRATNESGRMGADFDLLWMGLEGRSRVDPEVMRGWAYSQPDMSLYGATKDWYLSFTRHSDSHTRFVLRFLDAPVPQALLDFLDEHLTAPAPAAAQPAEGEPHGRLGDQGHDVSEEQRHSGDPGWTTRPAGGLQGSCAVPQVKPKRHAVGRRRRQLPR